MAPHIQLFARGTTDDSDESTLSPTIIAGIAVAASIGVGLVISFTIRFLRKRAADKRREDRRPTAFLNMPGVVKADEEKDSHGTLPADPFLSTSHPGGNPNRLSIASTLSSLGAPGKRKVHQLFDPKLPDELVVCLGEQLSVVQIFDDGWCIVGRDSALHHGDAELGAVPALCFLEPVKDLKIEPPSRVSSLGVTVNLDGGPGVEGRKNVVSWSNL
ncbi:hypothetical protein A0H81_07743 [Grifola frondosa]|uniref:SH3 domain-containing protein n=1 Tax=Grifola frondosa TaxID=5627 RepID=A0A1C7M6L2_GRIFR|nr:hypothetical protein A0H81_07743 [Grifola frondosa]